MQGQNLRQLWESLGPVGCLQKLTEALELKLLRPEDFSLRELAWAFCGENWPRALRPDRLERHGQQALLEAGDGVDVSAFSNITGQLFYTKIMEGWQRASRVADALVQTVPTRLDGEKLPWLGHIDGGDEEVRPGQPFPEVGFGERFIETPRTTKKGRILSLTREAIFFDHTTQMMRQADDLGEALAYRRELDILKVVLGLVNPYKLNGTANDTFQETSPWINTIGGKPLSDWTSIDEAYVLASQVVDPDTGLPLKIEFKQLLVMPAKLFTARRIVSATEISTTSPGYATSGAPQKTTSLNIPEVRNLEVLSTPLARKLLVDEGLTPANIDDWWFIGDFKRAFAWMENWPLTVVQAPPLSTKEFEQDIVARWKASYRGVAAVLEPRVVFKMYDQGEE
ncbi:MAG: hypothetical protein AB7K24_05745 [Gemmataceae bacterium]